MLVFRADTLRQVGHTIFAAAGAPADIAARVADALVDANLAGHDSHGVLRIPQYVASLAAGEIVPDARPEVRAETAASALVDGNWSFGLVAAEFATDLAIDRARRNGLAAVGLVRAHHIGRLGEYTTRAARQGVVALLFAGGFGGEVGAAPYGGAGIAFGTNPLSLGFPAGERPPVMVDFATTAVAAGKVRVARAKGEALPPGCISDREGRPSTDPNDFFSGGYLLPFGAHKGYGLAVAIELLGQTLTGADACGDPVRGGPIYGRSGATIIALDAGLFRPAEEFARAAEAVAARIKAVPPAPGFDEVVLPGEPEARAHERRSLEGIPVAESTWEAIRGNAADLGVDLDSLAG